MKAILMRLCMATTMLAAIATAAVPAAAMPVAPQAAESSLVIKVGGRAQWEQWEQRLYERRLYGPRRHYDPYWEPYRGRHVYRHHRPKVYVDFYVDGPYAYYRGHRGYRKYHPGYRHYKGYWFPPAAFIAGAIIGGAIASQVAPAPRLRFSPAHYEWCYARYRSYRASDNTFQPYHGPRRQCYSPYS
jgi:hypothetical protein